MSQPDSGEYSVRSLAEILREHGLESELGTRPGRRKRATDDPEATGRSPRVEPAPRASRPQGPSAPGRPAAAAPAAARTPPASSPAAARVPVTTWPDESANASRPAAGLAGPVAPVRAPAAARVKPAVREQRVSSEERMSVTGPVGTRSEVAPPPVRTGRRKSDVPGAEPPAQREPGLFGTGPTTSAIPALDATSTTTSATTTSATTGAATAGAAGSKAAAKTGSRGDAHPVTGPIPVQRAGAEPAPVEDDEPLTGRESVLAWARFAGEMVLALAVGIGLYFAFTVLWELMPYVALVAAPAAVTALVAGVAAYRQRRGQGNLGVRLLAVLLLAGTVLVIAPAAGLLAG